MSRAARLIKGMASFLPGRGISKPREPEPLPARYYYTVWMRHLAKAHQSGLAAVPHTVAEIGPGEALGVGLAAMLCGAQRFYAFDVVRFEETTRNLAILQELIELLRGRADIPAPEEFPRVQPRLEGYGFPAGLLTEERLAAALRPERVERIRSALARLGEDGGNGDGDEIELKYCAPWYGAQAVRPGTVDLICSQAVMEYVPDLPEAYGMMYEWLRPGGWISHTIDLRCHGTADQWDGHWTYSDLGWRIVRGNSPYSLNREPYTTHVRAIRRAGFEIVCDLRTTMPPQAGRRGLARRFRGLTRQDRTTSGCFLQAVKPA